MVLAVFAGLRRLEGLLPERQRGVVGHERHGQQHFRGVAGDIALQVETGIVCAWRLVTGCGFEFFCHDIVPQQF